MCRVYLVLCEDFILCQMKVLHCVMCITFTNGLAALSRAHFARFASVQHTCRARFGYSQGQWGALSGWAYCYSISMSMHQPVLIMYHWGGGNPLSQNILEYLFDAHTPGICNWCITQKWKMDVCKTWQSTSSGVNLRAEKETEVENLRQINVPVLMYWRVVHQADLKM